MPIHHHDIAADIRATLSRRPVRLGTRASPLAMAQAREVQARLCQAWSVSAEQVILCPFTASGDKITNIALRELGGKALWTRELDQQLAQGHIDAAVHSMKDVETIRPDQLGIAAILPRADARDMLFGATSIKAIPANAVLGTSSPRRAAQMRNLRPDIGITLFRGNVATRLNKLGAGDADITLLAKAGIDRLSAVDAGDYGASGVALSLDDWLPAPSQGAIGVEIRHDDDMMAVLLRPLDDDVSRRAVMAERDLLAALGGDCHSPIAAHAQMVDEAMVLKAALYSEDGQDCVCGDMVLQPGDTTLPAKLAQSLLGQAPESITRLFCGTINKP